MDQERWASVQFLFHETVDRPESERQQFLEKESGGDDALVADVLALNSKDGAAKFRAELASAAAKKPSP
ncbi:MAG TPA: hypothetical protein VES88_01920 [Gemmatimonadaceae bacterium]|nr:hypothetical protein [Gemmatimonadaceae bacterium]